MTLMMPGADVELVDEPGSERRRGLRIRQHRPVKIYEPMAGHVFGGQTEDVSATGLRVELPASASVRPGEMLNVHVGLNQNGQSLANRRQMMSATVVWVKRGGNNNSRRIGMIEAGIEFRPGIVANAA